MNFTETAIGKLQPRETRYDIVDDKVPALYLRVETTGIKTWYVYYRHPLTKQRVRKKLGAQEHLTVAQAREAAKNYVATAIITKEDPIDTAKKQKARPTIQAIIDTHYAKAIEKDQKNWKFTLECLTYFGEHLNTVAEDLDPLALSRWQAQQQAAGLKNSTINRRMTALQALLNWSVKMNLIATNPLKGKIDRQKEPPGAQKIRYLAPDERARLLAALEERDQGEKDYLKTAVLVSLNTGIRKGSLLALKWDDINWSQQRVLLRAETMKAEQARTIPLNTVALEALTEWRQRTESNDIKSPFVFPGETPNTHLGDTKKPWNNLLKKANIQHFSWHCMRHDFASQLAMMGVDLNTIKDLMCHESLTMTLNYAHLSPLHTAQASGRLAELYKKKG